MHYVIELENVMALTPAEVALLKAAVFAALGHRQASHIRVTAALDLPSNARYVKQEPIP